MRRPAHDLSHPTYRADIDGLRAIAVVAVVLFHAFPTLLHGGFVGVDVFFVISGYLISSIIFDNLDHERFSFAQFYARRIKRIFPALLLVLIACYCFGWLELTAPDFKRLGRHIGAGAGFVSNFILLKESGYFDADAALKPLLHLWSLAIEEQFYIIWPLLVWAAVKMRVNRLALILVITIGLFVLNIRTSHDPNEIARLYYSPQTRIWELLAGALLAHLTLYHSLQRLNQRSALVLANLRSTTGCVLLTVSFTWITTKTPFPGWFGLLPVLGTVLVISAGGQAWINRNVLANRVLVWFGLISFPLYLWHWPLLSLARIVETDVPALPERIGLVLLSILLAWFTKTCVEKPIRFGSPSKYVTLGLAAAMLAVGGVGYYTFDKGGLPERYGVAQLQMEPGLYDCKDREKNSGCSFGKADAQKLVVVWGDSHAEQYTNALRIALGDTYRFITATNGSCFMGEKVLFPDIGSQRDCGAAIDKIKALRGQAIYAVIRVQRWHGYGVRDKQAVQNAVNDAITAYDLQPQKVIILGASPDVDIECEVSNYYTRPLVDKKICKSVDHIKVWLKSFISATRDMTVASNVHFIYPYEIACPNDVCTVIDGHVAYFEDTHHFSTQGALRVVPYIERILSEQDGLVEQGQRH